jgi:hypothetical protein
MKIKQGDIKWLDKARDFVFNHKELNSENKLHYLSLLQNSNIDAWRDFIDGGYTPSDAITEDLSYAD